MAYLAIARKWRPNRFEDLVGQAHVVQTLKNAILCQRVSHAYLFSGARGIGKTSVARIFAKVLRCPNVKEGTPCNECLECQAITEGRSVDVVEIDGASNNGVEAIRGIRENVAYGAATGHYKIYIIDEVHMLSISAFNALLKTLEEPPAHVIFIFATTEAQKIPLTILSRCQRFEFRRLSIAEILSRLTHILSTENVTISEEGLRTIASHSDGSLRDALSLLDQVLSYYGEQETTSLDETKVVEALGVSESSHIRAFLASVLEKDRSRLVTLIGEVYRSGIDLKHFAERCMEEMRLLYLMVLAREGNTPLSAEELDISAAHFSELGALAGKASLVQIERMVQILSKAIPQLGWSSLPRFVLEMAAIRMSHLDPLLRIESALLKEGPLQPQASVQASAPTSKPITTATNYQTGVHQNTWQTFVDAVMKKRPLLGALLSHANTRIEAVENNKTVVLAFPEGSFYERQVADPKNRSDIEENVRMFFGKDTNIILSTQLNNTMASLVAMQEAEMANIKKTAMEHPTVIKMKEILKADVVDVTVEN